MLAVSKSAWYSSTKEGDPSIILILIPPTEETTIRLEAETSSFTDPRLSLILMGITPDGAVRIKAKERLFCLDYCLKHRNLKAATPLLVGIVPPFSDIYHLTGIDFSPLIRLNDMTSTRSTKASLFVLFSGIGYEEKAGNGFYG
jgi:hypothetical protein